MRKVIQSIAIVLLAALLASSTQIYALSPAQGVQGNKGEILSKVSRIAGNGLYDYADGKALDASFRSPQSIVVLADGSTLVSDSGNQFIRRIVGEEVSTYAGITFQEDERGLPIGGLHDGELRMSLFNQPSGMAADAAGDIYVADAGNHAIRKISAAGVVTTVAGNGLIGNEDGKGEAARFYYPQDVAIAKDGTLYVADTLNHVIRQITASGEVSTLNAHSTRAVEVVPGSVEPAGDYKDGALEEALFNEPSGLAIDHKGNLYVSDTGNQLIRYIDLSSGIVTTVAGDIRKPKSLAANTLYVEGGYADADALEAKLNYPKGLAVTEDNGLLIADSLNHAIRFLKDGKLITLAGNPNEGYGNREGINGYHLLHHPVDVAVHPDGSLFIADSYNNSIRQYTLYEFPENLPHNAQVKVVMNDQVISFDQQPEIVKGRTMVPVHAFTSEVAQELSIQWNLNLAEQSILLQKDDVTIAFKLGSTSISVTTEGGHKVIVELEQAPYMSNETIYVPLRLLSERLGLDVQWNAHNRTVIVREKG